MDYLSEFKERLCELMHDNRLSPKDLSEAINHNIFDIYHWKAGNSKSMPLLKNFLKIADYFCCSADFLIGLENENTLRELKPRPSFGKHFAAVIAKSGKSIHFLSIATGLNEGSFYDWINARYEPTLHSLIRLAAALDCSIDYLLGRE